MEIKGKYVTAIIYTDNIEGTALHQIEELCDQEFLQFQSTPPAWGATATLSKNYLQSCCSLLFRTKPTKYQ